MICYTCKKESGNVGAGVTLLRQGTVPGTHGMPRHIALCNDCMKKTSDKSEYEKQSRGT